MKTIVLPLLLVAEAAFGFTAGCAPSATPRSPRSAKGDGRDLLESGRWLAERGRYLDAGRYYEAALLSGVPEARVLPEILSCQVRAGRLRAAKITAERLEQIAPESQALSSLHALLEQLAPRLKAVPAQGDPS